MSDLNDPGSAATATGYGQPEPVSPAEADRRAGEQHGGADLRPELLAAGAFAGGFLLAQILKRMSGDD